ncbi:response regulator [Leptospira sarikeiensis]|uniref:histidine kinase n=1 Tax=Leptospira sarikeiensis TaxID=2484943 RepID=A0A4R9JYP7_9LEPT|nr:response regulator [Leptospira sarikeiensis]TGL58380.1 response regulator [Leptospira sarikeiensis]
MHSLLTRNILNLFCVLILVFQTGCKSVFSSEKKPEVENGILYLDKSWDFGTKEPICLQGNWIFYWSELYSEIKTSLKEDLDPSGKSKSKIEFGYVPGIWNEHLNADKTHPGFGFATYKMLLRLDKPEAGMAIKMLEASTAYNLYVNGKKVISSGTVGKTPETYKPLYRPNISQPFDLGTENEIAIEVTNYSHPKGGPWAKVFLGKKDDLISIRQNNVWLDLFISGGLFILGLYHLILFAFLRREASTLYYGILTILSMIRILITGERVLYSIFPSFDFEWGYRLELISVHFIGILFPLFIRQLYPDELSKRVVGFFIVAFSAIALVVLFTPLSIFAHTVPIFSILVTAACIYLIFVFLKAVRNKRLGAGVGLVFFLLLFCVAINDMLYANMIITTAYFISYGIASFFVAQAFMVSQRFSSAYKLSERLAHDLQESNQRLISLDKLKDEFLANTSHELRTPLQGIIGIADSLKRGVGGPLSESIERQLGMIVTSGQRLSSLVNDIIDFSKLKHKDLKLHLRSVDLFQAVNFTLELNRVGVNESKVRLVNAILPEFPELLADENRLQQILQNLVSNAIKFTEKGEIIVSAKIKALGLAEISVRDTGIGIDKDEHQKVFEFFEQVDRGDSKNVAGAGLGLAISRALVALHGGEIGVDSSLGSGSVFYFTIPLVSGKIPRSEGKDLRNYKEGSLQQSLGSLPKETTDSEKNARILVVDDEPVNLQVIQNYLSLRNISSVTAKSGMEALEILQTDTAFDVVILDVMMPKMSGLDTAREIRKTLNTLELPILMLTAKNQDKDLMAALNYGANDYLLKPFDFEELILRINNLLDLAMGHKSRLNQENEKREAVNTVRKRINIDLHDHLGGKLTDLKFLSEELLSQAQGDKPIFKKINEAVNQSIHILREQMLKIEDLGLLSENFITGINLVLLRRYSDVERDLEFECQDKLLEFFEIQRSETAIVELYSIVNEITNNDLKYGQGVSKWNFYLEGPDLVTEMNVKSSYHLKKHKTGRGTENLIYRISGLGGKVEMSLVENLYEIKIRIPVGNFTEK